MWRESSPCSASSISRSDSFGLLLKGETVGVTKSLQEFISTELLRHEHDSVGLRLRAHRKAALQESHEGLDVRGAEVAFDLQGCDGRILDHDLAHVVAVEFRN